MMSRVGKLGKVGKLSKLSKSSTPRQSSFECPNLVQKFTRCYPGYAYATYPTKLIKIKLSSG